MNNKCFIPVYKNVLDLNINFIQKIILSYFINTQKIMNNDFRIKICTFEYASNFLKINKKSFYRNVKMLINKKYLILKKTKFFYIEINTNNPFFSFLEKKDFLLTDLIFSEDKEVY